MMFTDRHDAGRQLGDALAAMRLENPVVLGVPRGGVIVAAEAARRIGADLDVVLVRKLRHPRQPEFAVGAVGEDGSVVLNEAAAGSLDGAELERERLVRVAELKERSALYRSAIEPVDVRGRDVLLVDDGVATGATMAAAVRLVRTRSPRRIIVALPVAPLAAEPVLLAAADDVVILHAPRDFWAVGQHYEEFTQTTDDEVLQAMAASAHR